LCRRGAEQMQRLRRGVIIVTVSFFLVLSWLMNLEFVPVDLDRHIAEMTAVNLGVGNKHHALSTLVLPPMLLEQLEFLVSTSWIGRKHFYKLLSIGFKDATHVLEWSWPGYFWDTFQRRRPPLDLKNSYDGKHKSDPSCFRKSFPRVSTHSLPLIYPLSLHNEPRFKSHYTDANI
jgi:hypothetical protein